MKNLLFMFATLVVILSCNSLPEETRILSKGPTDSVLVIDLPNASCSKCQKVIEEGLVDQLGVKQSILNLHTRQVSIVYASDQISKNSIEEKVSSLIPEMPCR